MLIPVQNTGNQKGLLFVVEGQEWNLYSANSNLNDIKNTFINCQTSKESDKILQYKYLALTTGDDISIINPLVTLYNNELIIEKNSIVNQCIFPINTTDLNKLINDIADYYRNNGYEIIFK